MGLRIGGGQALLPSPCSLVLPLSSPILRSLTLTVRYFHLLTNAMSFPMLEYEAATANPLAVFFLFTDIHVCGYKYPNKIISWLATGTGTDPGIKGSGRFCLDPTQVAQPCLPGCARSQSFNFLLPFQSEPQTRTASIRDELFFLFFPFLFSVRFGKCLFSRGTNSWLWFSL